MDSSAEISAGAEIIFGALFTGASPMLCLEMVGQDDLLQLRGWIPVLQFLLAQRLSLLSCWSPVHAQSVSRSLVGSMLSCELSIGVPGFSPIP